MPRDARGRFAPNNINVDVVVKVKGFNPGELDAWIGNLERAQERTVEAMAEDGARMSRELAPVGNKTDTRTKKIVDSIVHYSTRNTAFWAVVGTRHGLIIEQGGGPSLIPGKVSFWWEREARKWYPGDNVIHHPPTAAKPYLTPAFHAIMDAWPEYARRFYPQ